MIDDPHTLECIARTVQSRREQEAWTSLWPDYCKTCNGQGVFTEAFDPHSGGSSLELTDPCPDCTGKGICARCGQPGLDKDTGQGPCSCCGWNYDDWLPELSFCLCLLSVRLEETARG
jgi:hypothetical protein